MADASLGYITDVEYTADFHPDLAPGRLAYIAAINGYAAPSLGDRFTYCELGCGQGITSLILAATHPAGEFHSCDFNAAHIARAEALRVAAGVQNLRLYARSFGEMLDEDLPRFDFIALHGVWSWVPEAVRDQVLELIRCKLRPGGFVLASYNAMPGWAHLVPIRRMMRAFAETAPGDSLDKARAAYARVLSLARNRAGYFATLPAAAEHVERLAAQDIRYVAHEYLTPHGDPFWFDEAASAMAHAGLGFVGTMTPADNYAALMVPERFRDELADLASREAREAYRDIVANTSFRRDVYTSQPRAAPDREVGLRALATTAFCLADLPEALPLRRTQGWLTFDLTDSAAAVRAIHARLADGPALATELHRASGVRDEDEAAFIIQQLVVSAHLKPCVMTRPPAGWLQVNSALIEAGIRERWQRVPLACPLTGEASDTEVVSAAAIEAAAHVEDDTQAAHQVLARLRAHAHPVNRLARSGERRAASDDEIVAHVAAVARSLRDPAGAERRRLRLLGIL